jgi:glycosyltransferase involved in cell wall biosynthesis
MRILILNETAAPVGGELNHYVLDVAERLRATGDVVALVHNRLPKSEFRGEGYIFGHLRKMGAPPEEVRTRLEAIVDDFKPDVIQIHGVPNLAVDPWLAAKAPTARWIHNHLSYCSGGSMTWAWPGRKPCQRAHGPACLALHALRGCGSANPVENLVRYHQTSGALFQMRKMPLLQVASEMMKERLIRNGIDPARIETIPLYAGAISPSETRKTPPTPRRFILHPGELAPGKGASFLIRDIETLPEDVDLVFAGGGGTLEQPLKKFVSRRGLSKRVRIMGEVNPAQWKQLFSQATLIAMPSLWNEPLGLSGLCAMAHGKPVVTFQGRGIDEWLGNDQTGIVVPHGSRAAFVKAVGALLTDPARLQRLGKQAFERWNARFQPEHHLENLRAYYSKISDGSGGSSKLLNME